MIRIANTAIASFLDLNAVETSDLLAFYNAVTGKSTTKFASRAKGMMQVWALISVEAEGDYEYELSKDGIAMVAKKAAPAAEKKEKPAKAEKAERKSRGFRFKFQKREEIKTVKAGSKREVLLNLLKQKGGATFEECMAATGWNRKDCYEAIRLLHYYVGYGLDMNEETGKIWVVA